MTDFQALRGLLRAALVSDALDALGHRRNCLGFQIAPLDPDSVLVGRAFTVASEPVDAVPDAPYVGLLRALDAIGPDEVWVMPTGRPPETAFWGELLTNVCLARGAAGVVTDGLVRDVQAVRALGFPVFAGGTIPYDINGRYEVTGTGEPALIDGVTVEHGDLVVGDVDGVAVVPAALEDEVVARVSEKASGEGRFREAVRGGMAPSQAFERFGVL